MTAERPARDAEAGQAEEQRRRVEVLEGIADFELSRLRRGQVPWNDWLTHAHRHGRYGLTNTLLIGAQRPEATDVRSYDDWRRQGRQVRAGEAAIRIISRAGRSRPVFDVEQTDGEQRSARSSVRPEEALQRLYGLATELELYVDRGQRWSYAGRPERRISVAPDLDAAEAATLLAHQFAHVLQRGERVDVGGDCHGVRRVRADSIAYLVLAGFGMDVAHLSFPPVRAWAGTDPRANPQAAIRTVGESVLRIASRIRALPAHASPGSQPRVTHGAKRQDDVLSVHAEAHEFYRGRLAGSWVPGYLAERGFGDPVLERWQIGYAPAERNALVGHLSARGFARETLLDAGLAKLGRDGKPYDLFRDRVILPLRAADGAVVAFIGRRRDGAPGPKYLNSPETAVFRKGEVLFGLHEGRERLERGGRPLIVEGPFDVIAVENAAVEGKVPVAPCGTVITGAQLEALARHADLADSGVLLALDGDDPGAKATLRAWGALQQVEGPVEAARLPEGTDPADILRYHGFGGVREALHSVVPLADLVVDATIERAGGELEHAENRLAAARAAAALITQLKPHEVARQVARVADRTGLAISDMTAVLTAAVSPDVPPGDVATATEDFPSAPLARIGPATGQKERPPQPAEATRRVTSPRSSQGRTT